MPFFENARNFSINNGTFNTIAGDFHYTDNRNIRNVIGSNNTYHTSYTNSYNNNSRHYSGNYYNRPTFHNGPVNNIGRATNVNFGPNYGFISQGAADDDYDDDDDDDDDDDGHFSQNPTGAPRGPNPGNPSAPSQQPQPNRAPFTPQSPLPQSNNRGAPNQQQFNRGPYSQGSQNNININYGSGVNYASNMGQNTFQGPAQISTPNIVQTPYLSPPANGMPQRSSSAPGGTQPASPETIRQGIQNINLNQSAPSHPPRGRPMESEDETDSSESDDDSDDSDNNRRPQPNAHNPFRANGVATPSTTPNQAFPSPMAQTTLNSGGIPQASVPQASSQPAKKKKRFSFMRR